MILNLNHTYNVGFSHKSGVGGGGIASVKVEPTKEMLSLTLKASNLRAEAQRLADQSYDIGQKIAQEQFRQKNPDLVC